MQARPHCVLVLAYPATLASPLHTPTPLQSVRCHAMRWRDRRTPWDAVQTADGRRQTVTGYTVQCSHVAALEAGDAWGALPAARRHIMPVRFSPVVGGAGGASTWQGGAIRPHSSYFCVCDMRATNDPHPTARKPLCLSAQSVSPAEAARWEREGAGPRGTHSSSLDLKKLEGYPNGEILHSLTPRRQQQSPPPP